jgi:predicted nucleic acid-binding Zn ribbon protein
VPIWEYKCKNCGNKVEKITLSVRVAVPDEIAERCPKCMGKTRHLKVVSAPAFMKVRKPGTGPVATMRNMRPPKDKHWKQRVKEGLTPDGQKLTNMKEQSLKDWAAMTSEAVGGDAVLHAATQEAKERAAASGFVYNSPVAAVREAVQRGDPIPDVQPRFIRK